MGVVESLQRDDERGWFTVEEVEGEKGGGIQEEDCSPDKSTEWKRKRRGRKIPS